MDEASVSFAKENVKCNDLDNNVRGMDIHVYVFRFPPADAVAHFVH